MMSDEEYKIWRDEQRKKIMYYSGKKIRKTKKIHKKSQASTARCSYQPRSFRPGFR
jgi:hypothetical protein